MHLNPLIKLFHDDKPVINGWLSIPNSFTAEAMSRMGWDSITIDMQHGQNDYNTSIPMLQAIANGSAVPIARVPWSEPGIIMRMLDLGVMGIIAPMINSRKECEDFVSYCYYPSKGQRSFGPMRAQLIYGSDYYENANDQIVSLAMIETKEAVDNIDEILSVPNLTGIYVGPGDMCSSYGMKPQFDVKKDPIYSTIRMIANKAKQNGKIAGIHNGTVNYAKEMIELGYKFVTVSSDFRSMSAHAQNIVNEMKNTEKGKASSSTY